MGTNVKINNSNKKSIYTSPPPKRIIDEDIHPIKFLKNVIKKLNQKLFFK